MGRGLEKVLRALLILFRYEEQMLKSDYQLAGGVNLLNNCFLLKLLRDKPVTIASPQNEVDCKLHTFMCHVLYLNERVLYDCYFLSWWQGEIKMHCPF